MLDNLKIAISEGDIASARKIMISELIGNNYPHEVFRDALDLASEYSVFENHDNGKLVSDPNGWNKEYLDKLISKLEYNFSRERFLTTYYVARKIDKEKIVNDVEEQCAIKVYDKYKDFFLIAQIGAAVVGAAAVGIGVYLFKKKRKNN